jgi:RNA polymerase sigma-70 factor, ECF subfamily
VTVPSAGHIPGRPGISSTMAGEAGIGAGAVTWQAAWPPLLVDNGRVLAPERAADERLRALMVGYQDGQRDAFEQLYALLAPIVRGQLMRLARDPTRVDDLVQETFLQIHRARHTYDPAFPVPPWARAVARHVFLMECRYRRRRGDLSRLEPLDDSAPSADGPHDEALIARVEVRRALDQLSPATRASVLLHHLHGLSFKEISRRLRVRGPALRARASRGMARLREVLDDDEDRHEPE